MNNRRSTILMLAIGALLITGLSLVPYSLTFESKLKQQTVALWTKTPQGGEAAAQEPEKPASREPSFDVVSWYAARAEAPEAHGVLIETLDGSRVFAQLNADATFNPASLMKLSTSLVALRKLGPDFRFKTEVYVDGKVDNKGVLRGKLYVIGDDPTFGDYDATLINQELQARGIKRINGEVSVSQDFAFNFAEKPEESAKRLIKVLQVGNPKPNVADVPTGERALTIHSNPLREILLYMNAFSSNFIAERIGALVGGPAGVRQFLIDEVNLLPDQVSIQRTSGREHNRMTARGLLQVLRALIEETKRQGMTLEDIMAVASDDSGTLRRRLVGTGIEGAVIAKTGTLTQEVDGGMSSLAGVIYTEDAGPVLFALLDQGHRIHENKEMEDQLLAEIMTQQSYPKTIANFSPRSMLPSAGLQVEKP